jgi:von Willebrand factor type A domain
MNGRMLALGFAVFAPLVLAACSQPQAKPAAAQAATAPSTPVPAGSTIFPMKTGIDRPRSVAFVCDASGSMKEKWGRLASELMKAVNALRPDQQFSITVFQWEKPATLDAHLLPATDENKLRAQDFLEDVQARGDTDPILGLEEAMHQRPDVMYLVTDGDFPDDPETLKVIRTLNSHATTINTVAFLGRADHDEEILRLLQTVADETGGAYQKVDADKLIETYSLAPRYRIVFLLNAGESMAPKMGKLRAELDRAIEGFHPNVRFDIIFMQPGGPAYVDSEMMHATPENKRRAKHFVDNAEAGGETNPYPAIEMAMALDPTQVYLLTDSDFADDRRVRDEIRQLDPEHKIRFQTIAFVGPADDDTDFIRLLKQIASESGGTFKTVNVDSLANSPATQP